MSSLQFLAALPEDIRKLARENAARGKLLNPLLDTVFKTLFSGGSEDSQIALRSILAASTRREISGAQVLNSEILPEYLAGKTIHLDVHAAFNDGDVANLEMQMRTNGEDIPARAVFSASRLLSGQARKGDRYDGLKRVYQIFFLNTVLFPNSPLASHRYTLREETEQDPLNDLIEIIFYELPKLAGKVGRILRGTAGVENLSREEKWCIYLRYHQDKRKSPLIKELCREEVGIMSAEKVLTRVSADYETWARALFREKAEMDYRSVMHSAYARGLKEREAQVQEAKAQAQEVKAQVQEAEVRTKAAIRKLRELGVAEDIIAASFPISFQ